MTDQTTNTPEAEEANPLLTIAALDDAVEALIEAAKAAAELDPDAVHYNVHGYRVTFSHRQLISLVAA